MIRLALDDPGRGNTGCPFNNSAGEEQELVLEMDKRCGMLDQFLNGGNSNILREIEVNTKWRPKL
jgi:hypothetical protein